MTIGKQNNEVRIISIVTFTHALKIEKTKLFLIDYSTSDIAVTKISLKPIIFLTRKVNYHESI